MPKNGAKRTKTKQVGSLRHQSAKRRHIATAEQQSYLRDEEQAPLHLRYPRNTDLDPQLVWRGKDAEDDRPLGVDAVPIYIQEKIHPHAIVADLQRRSRALRQVRQGAGEGEPQLGMEAFWSDFNGLDEPDAEFEFYGHDRNWTNRMILGDALLVMASLAEKEALRGQVQCIYFDPPYGIKFNSNWQVSTKSRDVKDGKADQVAREPEVVKAFRDTWSDGINTYLSYLRDRLTLARDLLHESGSLFVQIGDENVHLVRSLMDEVFGREKFVGQIAFKTTSAFSSRELSSTINYVVWFSKAEGSAKFNQLYALKDLDADKGGRYTRVLESDGARRVLSATERADHSQIPADAAVYRHDNMYSQGRAKEPQPFEYSGNDF